MTLTGFAKFAWGLLAYNVLVILWGALVSSTGSGAGCGNRWPDCNGVIAPDPSVKTVIEFSHRLTSGLDGLLVIGFVLWAWRAFPAGHRVRTGAVISLALVLTEGLIGALLVRQGWTAFDTSVERVIMQPLHFVNTLLLLAAVALTAWWASGGAAVQWRGAGWQKVWFGAGVAGVFFIGSSGAIISLGDLLADALGESHNTLVGGLVSLRLWHPAIAIGVGLYLLWLAFYVARATPNDAARRFARLTCGLVVAQWLAGFLNVLLRAPVWMQLLHLLLADATWIALVLWSASALAQSEALPAVSSVSVGRGAAAD